MSAPEPRERKTRSYEGTWIHDKRHGKGIYCDEDGGRYEGEFDDGVYNGVGTFTKNWPHGDSYEGEWVQGVKHGHGIKRYADGNFFEGVWVHGKRVGTGEFTLDNVGAKRPTGKAVSVKVYAV